jgi:hypothetical protein
MVRDDGQRAGISFYSGGPDGLTHPTGKPVNDRDQAFAVAKRLAIDIAETRQEYLGKGCFVSVVDDAQIEIHRESVDSAEKSG